jgi:hypothetical protein
VGGVELDVGGRRRRKYTLHIHPTQKGFGYLKWIIIEENGVERKRNSS